jgi:glycosyltransferase involved in cell wall biosynthesis
VKVSVIVPTYNRPAALRLCLLSLTRQTLIPEEVLVADDGSGEETAEVVRNFARSGSCPFELKHVWQEDDGFRKPKILNETARQSTGDFLVFIDGDCMAHRKFVQSHLQSSGPDVIASGKRVDLGSALTEKVLRKGRPLTSLTLSLLFDSIFSNSRKAEEALRITSPFIRRLLHRDAITDDGVWGCNFSVYRELFYKINGCDEDFLDGSIEDNDLGIRVLNYGGRIQSVRALAIVFHLWHRSTWSFANEKFFHNKAILDRRISRKEFRCENGLVPLPMKTGDDSASAVVRS